MAIMPITIPLPSESAVASYDWQDIISGFSYQTFYLGALLGSAAILYKTAPFVFTPHSAQLFTKTTTTSTSYVKSIDLSFSSSVSTARRTLKGDAIINLSNVAYNNEIYWVITIKKNTTTIATLSTLPVNGAGVNVITSAVMAITETVINPGETINIFIEGWQKKIVGSNTDLVLLYDPMDRATNVGTMASGGASAINAGFSCSRINLPFKIDL